MSETENPQADTQSLASPPAKNSGVIKGHPNLRPWPKGTSGNPAGRPRIEPRVRRKARRYDSRMVAVLAAIAEDPKAPWAERRRAAMDLIAVGSGRPSVTQEVLGRPDAPLGPLVAISMNGPVGGGLSPQQARQLIFDHPSAPPEQLAQAEAVLQEAALPAPVSDSTQPRSDS